MVEQLQLNCYLKRIHRIPGLKEGRSPGHQLLRTVILNIEAKSLGDTTFTPIIKLFHAYLIVKSQANKVISAHFHD